MCVGFIAIVVSAFSVPPRRPSISRARRADLAVLGVVHQAHALRHAMRDDHARDDDAVAVVRLDPVVVAHVDRLGVLRAHPQPRAAAEQREHVQVVLVLGVDRPLRVRRQVAQRHLRDAVAGDRLGAGEHQPVVDRRPVGGQALAELAHPGVVEVEVHAPRQRVPGLVALDVDRERGVGAALLVDARPLRRGDHPPRLHLRVLEGDPRLLGALGQVGERHAAALLQRAEAGDARGARW